MAEQKKGNARLIVTGIVVAAAMILAFIFREQVLGGFGRFREWVDGAGAFGVLAFVLLYMVSTVAFLPGWPLTVGAGLTWGVLEGTVYTSIASTLGATLAFLCARSFLRQTIERKVAGNESFTTIDNAIAQSGWRIVFLIRLSPAFPFNLLNYALGLTRIRLVHYFFASWAGMLPGTVMYVYLGSLGNFFAADREKSVMEQVAFVVGLGITAVVTVMITNIARRALKKQASQPPDGESGSAA